MTQSDQPQRDQALDIQQSWIVEAPAGSGKTGLLIQRFLKLLAGPAVTQPGQVLAITFTRKATHEVRDRLLEQLTAAANNNPPENAFDAITRPYAEAVLARDAALGWNLLENPRLLRVRTIDGTCAEIAGSLPVLSGSGGGLTPVEDAKSLHREAARNTLKLLGSAQPELNDALKLLLLHRDGNLANCETLIADMLAVRDQWAALIPLTQASLTDASLDAELLPRLERVLDLVICRALTNLSRIVPLELQQRFSKLAQRMSHHPPHNIDTSPIESCRNLHAAPGQAAADLKHWEAFAYLATTPSGGDWRKAKGIGPSNLKFEIPKPDKADLVDLIADLSAIDGLCKALCELDTLPPLHYPADQWRVTKALFRVLARALVELQIIFAERGQCDFTELGLLARTALRSSTATEDISNASGMALQHLLVDEVQDTSNSQYELIQLLTQHWDGHSQTVFLVGDPKQSIYLFRQARVERFLETMHSGRLGDLPLKPLRLNANFRSQARLVDHFNQTFGAIFPSPAAAALLGTSSPANVPYSSASPARDPAVTPESGLQWHLEPIPYQSENTQKKNLRIARARQEAAEIASILATWRAANPLSKTAVLVRTRNHLIRTVQALRAAGIPYRAIKIDPLGERPEILDLKALTRALQHPADRVAWFALLRSPYCGLSLSDLHLLAGQDDKLWSRISALSLIESRGAEMSEDGISRLTTFFSIMSAADAKRGLFPLTAVVYETWRNLQAPQHLSAEQRENAEQFFTLLYNLQQAQGDADLLDLDRLETALDELFAAPSTAPDAVDLMTIHGAKGLEWDVVIVPALERLGGSSKGQLLAWLEIDLPADAADEIAPGILAPLEGKGAGNQKLNQWIKDVNSGRDAAERTRLFYVVCTRAREELHLFASPARKKDNSVDRRSGTLLHSSWSAAEPFVPALDLAETSNTETPTAETSNTEPSEADLAAPEIVTVSENQLRNTLLQFPVPANSNQVLQLAASGDASTLRWIERTEIPEIGQKIPQITPQMPAFSPSKGAFAARAFGTAFHDFLDLAAKAVASGTPPGVATWQPRIQLDLRRAGLSNTQAIRASSLIQSGLAATLADRTGRWILADHPESQSEIALTAQEDATKSIRIDRIFKAGPTPGSTGQDVLWIIDYKTSTQKNESLTAFLQAEKERYSGQLEGYADLLAEPNQTIHLGLYFPLLTQFIWWKYENKAT